jgi:CRISPR/Cas system CSM-associated protein Csm3 (group 7 of RAMP superfamily)
MPQYNPYHFVPVLKGARPNTDEGQVTHERYVPKTFSGVFTCSVTLDTPVAIGSERDRPAAGGLPFLQPLLIPTNDGTNRQMPILPGSSLRGMIGAIIEAASNSALRILDKKTYEVRVPNGRVTERQIVPMTDMPNEAATAWDFFGAVDRQLLPLHPSRKTMTPAELLLGYVEETEEAGLTKNEKAPTRTLASRVRFSDALPSSPYPWLGNPVNLKILSSPKPSTVVAPSSKFKDVASPCPSMYMKPAEGPSSFVSKVELRPGAHWPQGRKFYLHHQVAAGTEPWKSTVPRPDPKQQVQVQPILAKTTFQFTVEFDNLSLAELLLLLFALKPSASFGHRLGMGKPLGLGSVTLEVVDLQIVNRPIRYTAAGLFRPRSLTPKWWTDWRKMVDKFATETLEPSILQALLALGETIPSPVRYPIVPGQQEGATETYRWFVENEKGLRRFLKPISERTVSPLD